MIQPFPPRSPEQIAESFRIYSQDTYPGASSLYQALSEQTPGDRDLLALAGAAPKGQPIPNLLFGAVHFLLLSALSHPLAQFYPSVVDDPLPPQDAFPAFRSFCVDHREEILAIMQTRLVQTNEVRRCACLLPGFSRFYREGGNHPLALVEIGPSAGLNLIWDRYGYDYGGNRRYGNPDSAIQLQCELRGGLLPPLEDQLPTVASRAGVDLNPIDVRDPLEALWLRALVWPEQQERAVRLQQAIQMAQLDPPRLIRGDAVDLAPELAAEADPESTVCLCHSFTLNQVSETRRDELWSRLAGFSEMQEVYLISLEWKRGVASPGLELTVFRKGERSKEMLAWCDRHGAWLEWLAE